MPQDGTPGSPLEGRLTAILDNLLEGCQVVGPDWRYLHVNEAAAEQGRRPRNELLGRTMMEAYPGIETTPMFARLRACMVDRIHQSFENEFAFPDGAQGWFELRFAPVPEGVFILSLDISRRKWAEARITHLNTVLRGIRDVNQLITREADPGRLIRQACALMVEARGFDAVAIVLTGQAGLPIRDRAEGGRRLAGLGELLDRGQLPDCAREAIARGDTVVRRVQAVTGEGRPLVPGPGAATDELVQPLARDGRTYGFMVVHLPGGMGEDAEERQLLREVAGDLAFALHAAETRSERDASARALSSTQEQLFQAQKLEAVGRLAGGLAHDFNNILAAQLGCCEFLEEQLRPDDPLAEDVATIRSCTERAAELTRQLLAFSRTQPMQVQVLDLNRAVRGVESMLRRLLGEDIRLETALAADLGPVSADPGQLEQVIVNLAVNARDAMPEGGLLSIETAAVELDEEYARSHVGASTGPHVMLAISDTGCGMDAETRERIFEPFFTTKERGRGSGLGLATVYGIVKQSGGNIWVYSEPGKGTAFRIYLPRVAGEVDPEPLDRTRQQVERGRNELVLVVEDDPVLRVLFERQVRDFGYRAVAAADGAGAIAAVERDGLRPDVLLTDVVMPGLSGRALAGRLVAFQPGLRVLYVSGYTNNAIFHQGLLEPGVAYLQKPFTGPDLARRLREVLDAG
ncbi:MAG: response regulator [Krumholzibacteria bacterium]|nr:response regulator [Candidatus Krumholzibacteria bacterium]